MPMRGYRQAHFVSLARFHSKCRTQHGLLEAPQNLDFELSRGQINILLTSRVNVVHLKWPLSTVVPIIGMNPSAVRRIEAPCRIGYRNACRKWRAIEIVPLDMKI